MSWTMTPGPWETPGIDGVDRVVSATVKGRRRTIAHVYAPYMDHDEAGEERDANARAIAAVPEMVEALRKCLEVIESAQDAMGVGEQDECAAESARAALAKAGVKP